METIELKFFCKARFGKALEGFGKAIPNLSDLLPLELLDFKLFRPVTIAPDSFPATQDIQRVIDGR